MEYTVQKLRGKNNPKRGQKLPPPVTKNTKKAMGLTGQAGKAAKALAERNRKMKEK